MQLLSQHSQVQVLRESNQDYAPKVYLFSLILNREMWLLHIGLNTLACSGWHEVSVQIAYSIYLTVSCMGGGGRVASVLLELHLFFFPLCQPFSAYEYCMCAWCTFNNHFFNILFSLPTKECFTHVGCNATAIHADSKMEEN